MTFWADLAAAFFALLVAVCATFVARRLLGAPVGWLRGLVVGVGFYLVLTPTLNRVVEASDLVDVATLEIKAAPAAIAAVLGLALVWAFLLGVTVLLVWEVLVPTGSVRDPVTWVRDVVAGRRRTRRYVRVGAVVAKHGLRRLARRDPRRGDSGEVGRALVDTLQDSGVTFVKFGQVLSTRSDLLPPALVAELATLQSNVAPERWADLVVVVDSELPGWHERLEIEHAPLAAASIAQVHRARLRPAVASDDDDDAPARVVVKVQRPEAAAQVKVDTDILGRLTRTLSARAPWAREMDVAGLAEGFSTALVEELDYRREAENMRLVGAALGVAGVRVPIVYDDVSTPRILVMEEVDGVTLDRAGHRLDELSPETRHRLASTLMSSVLHQVLVSGVFHADLHPGNIVLTPEAELVLLDFGSVGILDRELRGLILGLLAAFDAEDNQSAVALLLRLMPPGEYDTYQLRRDLGQAMTVIAGGSGLNAAALARLFEVFREHRLALPPHVAAALRTMGSLQGCLEIIEPGVDLADLVRGGTKEVARALADAREIGELAVSRGLSLAAIAEAAPAAVDEGARGLIQGRPIRSAVAGMARITRAALAELVPTIVACVLVLSAVGLFAIPGGPMLTQSISWATYLAAFVGAAGTALVLRVLFRQTSPPQSPRA